MSKSIFLKNIEALKQRNPELASMIVNASMDFDFRNVVKSDNGFPVLRLENDDMKYYLEDVHDPWKAANVYLERVHREHDGLVVFVGMGLGYGPLLIHRERPRIAQLVIIEPKKEIFLAALKTMDLSRLFLDRRVNFLVGDVDFKVFSDLVYRNASLRDITILRHIPSFKWSERTYSDLANKIYEILNKFCASGSTIVQKGKNFIENIYNNLELLPKGYVVNALEGKFRDIPAIVIGAGPSLEKDLPLLKSIQNNAILISVDSALPVLLTNGITPHFVTTIDMQLMDVEKVACAFEKKNPFSLVAALKCGYLMPRMLHVEKLFWAISADASTLWLAEFLNVKKFLPPAASVSHLALGFALLTDANPIILIGQDLCYPEDRGFDHAKGTVFHNKGIVKGREILSVPGLQGSNVTTDRVMLTIKTQFEEIIHRAQNEIINSTSYGAEIKGVKWMSLQEVVKKYIDKKNDIYLIINKKFNELPSKNHNEFITELKMQINKLKRVKKEIKSIRQISSQILSELRTIPNNRRRKIRSLDELSKNLKKKIIKYDKKLNLLDSKNEVWNLVIELTYDALKLNDDKKRQNENILNDKGYLEWLFAEIKRMDDVQEKRLDAINFLNRYISDLYEFLNDELYLTQKGDYESLGVLYLEKYHISNLMELLFDPNINLSEQYVNLFKGFIQAIHGKDREAIKLLEDIPVKFNKNSVINHALEKWYEFLTNRFSVNFDERKYFLAVNQPHLASLWLNRIRGFIKENAELKSKLIELCMEYLEDAKSLEEKGYYDYAFNLIKCWDNINLDIEEKNTVKIRLLYKMNKIDEALSEIKSSYDNLNEDPEFLSLCSRILLEAGDLSAGIELLNRAQSLDPKCGQMWFEIGEAAFENQDYEGAVLALKNYLAIFRDDVQALRLLGEALSKLGHMDQARKILAQAVEIARRHVTSMPRPGVNEVPHSKNNTSKNNTDDYLQLFKQAVNLQAEGKHREAIDIYEKALSIVDSDPNLWQNLGVAYHKCKLFEKAEKALLKSIEVQPSNIDAVYNLGVLYLDQKLHDQAKQQFHAVLALNHDHLGACNNLAHILFEFEEKPAQALPLFERALKENPKDPRNWYNVANCLWSLRRLDESIEHYEKAIELEPNFVKAHWNLSNVLLLKGELQRGFQEYLWRWKRPGMGNPETLPVKLWHGETLDREKVLVYTEQGAGDNIQFVRYLEMLKKRNAKIILASPTNLIDLFSSLTWFDEVINKEYMHLLYNEVKWQCPLLNLPTIFKTDLDSIPRQISYLRAPNHLVSLFNAIFMKLLGKELKSYFKIGFVWKGNPKHSNDKNRSCRFEDFMQLFDVPGTQWFSLQLMKEPLPVRRDNLFNMAPYLASFAHTAAIIEHLDLVISVDTSVAHLAGALGKPVWTLLPWLPDWRWGIEGESTPWYPTMRLIRQERPKDWEGVFKKMRVMLEELLSKQF